MSKEKLENYIAVLADLRNERKELESHIEWIEVRIRALGGVSGSTRSVGHSSYAQQQTIAPKHTPFQAKPPGTSNPDLCELVLKDHGSPLHIKDIFHRLADRGRSTTIKSLSGSMPQDKNKRFENLGDNIWALTAWPEEMKSRYRKQGAGRLLNDI